ncbi:DUF2851 family protein [Sediminibacter sp. Hel_I_10]|uniref:DUF2851 family protein n=1 Tax=Sediminibacter sp. Hel_I_10 TaxID=1392490 RepID=UPI00047B49EB|nr:DUF2851 family protein [Sediminibacter sp. Hel_I_10]
MQEDVLHYIWKHKKLDVLSLRTTQDEVVEIISVGRHNFNSGPDFFNAQLKIGNQLWAGNVEIHIKSSDWYVHNHEQDVAYDNVILHVVHEHDTDVFRKNNTVIPTLELKNVINPQVLANYDRLFSKGHKWINCEADIQDIDNFVVSNWLQRLFIERLERKSKLIEELLKQSKNDWEAVLFKMLTKSFGLKVNGEAFLSIANSIDFSVIRKVQSNQEQLESLLFGQSGLLDTPNSEPYYHMLKSNYEFLSQKFQLENTHLTPLQFFRLRPPNFPTIRLSQLATLYAQEPNLFSKVIEINSVEEFYKVFRVGTSNFWKSHYTFDKISKTSEKRLTTAFVDLILINTILPLKFCYAKHQGMGLGDEISELMGQIKPEVNGITKGFERLKVKTDSALDSQALIQLKSEYCDKNRCLQCAIGNSLLGK